MKLGMEEDPFSHLSPTLLHFLHLNLRTRDDLLRSPSLAAALLAHCSQLDSSLSQLSRHLSDRIADHASLSESRNGALDRLKSDLGRFGSSSMSGDDDDDDDKYDGDGDGYGEGKGQRVWGEELQALAKEVARVESIRSYAGINLYEAFLTLSLSVILSLMNLDQFGWREVNANGQNLA